MLITSNDPSAGYVSWSGVTIKYKGVTYTIADDNSNKAFIWWDFTTPTVFLGSATMPTMTDNDFVAIYNDSGTYQLAGIRSRQVHGGMIMDGTIPETALEPIFASDIDIVDDGGYYTGIEVETALAELGNHSAWHENGGADEVNVAGLSGELVDNQPPKAHESSHNLGGSDVIKLDNFGTPDDNTDLDASNATHGLMRKFTDETDKYFDASGNFNTPVLLEYSRDISFAPKTVSVAADRYKILSPNRMFVYFNSKQFYLSAQTTLDLSLEATWDSIATDYRVAANRAGKDFYIYACNTATRTPDILVSDNSSAPSGYTTTTSKKIGGFHCLCVAVGTIASHTLTDYVAGDVLPQSVWDLKHMPASNPEGMVYDSGTDRWVDIYLASVSGSALVSVNGGTIADGASAPVFHWYKFDQWFGNIKKKMADQNEFVSLSLGANQGTNITGSADPVTTGGHSDTAGRRMISNIGCEDSCGVLWQWGRDRGGPYSASSWVNAYDGNDSGVGGQHYNASNCVQLGGRWNSSALCGSRSSFWLYGPLILSSTASGRGLSENRRDWS